MKILLVVPLFPPDKGVSTLRAKFFYEELSNKYHVDILKLGESTNLSGNIKTVEKKLFTKLTSTLWNVQKIKHIIGTLLKDYDCIIVSAPPYNMYAIGKIAVSYSIPVIYDYRDQPDLIYYDKTKNKPWNIPHRWLLLKLLELYIHSSFKNAYAILCVGQLSTALLQNKFKSWKNIYNCHNGFLETDLLQFTDINSCDNEPKINIGWSGSIYPFRDSQELRDILKQLDVLAKITSLRIMHWGITNSDLTNYISTLRYLQYQQMEPIDRDEYLIKMSQMDAFILTCSESLIWEPTTTVFDYILFNKPVIYSGLRNNEAINILSTSGVNIIELNELIHLRWLTRPKIDEMNISNKMLFSRKYQFKIVENLLNNLAAHSQ